jgi:TonB family protein
MFNQIMLFLWKIITLCILMPDINFSFILKLKAMKKAMKITYIGLLYGAMAMLNLLMSAFGTNKKLINRKLLLGSMILMLVVVSPKKTQAQKPCYKPAINHNEPMETVYVVVDEMPTFPGGEEKCIKFIEKNLQYPLKAKDNKVEGVVFVSFVVKPDGTLTNHKVLNWIGYGCDEEALRIVYSMPKWKPGKQGGKAVWVQYTLPIKFSLENK